ncbi:MULTISPECIES: thiamine pyrophosphate-binding protein [Streptomyces violaceusniger group]|uniref:thiamine pyrophosphate-binding protein n=1 Tax=Streptomyces violaceusniger group TaxID=2839105 RepID=UPI001BA67071|nr:MULTISPECIES: thiamine pyrophosphate-binding protein [Streptomyces violaceusniger group]
MATASGVVPRVAHDVARALQDSGVDRVFLITGGDLWLWRALRDHGIEMCLARSEAASVVMADAYARVTGRPAVVYGQWGPGAANVAAALADARWAHSPLVALTSTVSTRVEYKYEYQELDQPPMFQSVTKWQARVTRADRAGELVAQALRIAGAGAPGPVHIDIPCDILAAEAVEAAEAAPSHANANANADALYAPIRRPAPSAPSAAAVADIADRLARSLRPVLLAGNGVLMADAAEDLTRLAETVGVPVLTTLGGKGSIAENHPLSVGVAGRYASKVANGIAREADFVLAIGTDLGGLATDTYTLPSSDADVVQVDVVAEHIGRTRTVDAGVVADAGELCRALAVALPSEPGNRAHHTWRESVRSRCATWQEAFRAVAHRPAAGHVRPEAVVAILRELADDRDLLVADTGFMGAWGGALFPVHAPGRTFLRAAGTLGWAFPAVLGAQLAAGAERRAFALVGDGGFGYHVGDLETALRLDIPAVTIVLNNASLAYEHVGFKHALGEEPVSEVCDFLDVDHAKVAAAYGVFAARVDSADAFRGALEKAIAAARPALIDVVVSKERVAPVTTFDTRLVRDV